MANKRYAVTVLLLGALTALAPFSIDTYLPGFPAIAKSFNIPVSKVSLSLSSFFLGIALGQILYGPLLDRYGRKPPLYAGLFLYLIATIGCYQASSIEVLIAFRFVQALGSCAAGVVAMAMVRDMFPVEENAKIFSLLMLVLGTSPMIAPSAGSLLVSTFGWRSIFISLLLLAGLILTAAVFLLPESRPADKMYHLKVSDIIRTFREVIGVRQFFTYAVGGSIMLSGLFAYLSSSPAIFMEGFGVSNSTYGWIFALITLGFVGISQFNRLLSKRYSQQKIVFCATIVSLVLAAIFLYGTMAGRLNLAGVAVFIFLILGCIGIINPNAAALSMAPFESKAGVAASLFGCLQWSIAGLVSLALSFFKTTTAVPLAAIMVGTAVLALLILTGAKQKQDIIKLS